MGIGAATGPDMAEGLKIKNLADVSKSHSAMSGPVTAPSTCLALSLSYPLTLRIAMAIENDELDLRTCRSWFLI